MALISCYECGKEVSDLALSCPHCGAPRRKGADVRELPDSADARLSDNQRASLLRDSKSSRAAIICWIFAIVIWPLFIFAFRHWLRRRTARVLLKRNTIEPFFPAYLRTVLPFALMSLVILLLVAIFIAALAGESPDIAGAFLAGALIYWPIAMLFTLDVPFGVRTRAKRGIGLKNADSVKDEQAASNQRDPLFLAGCVAVTIIAVIFCALTIVIKSRSSTSAVPPAKSSGDASTITSTPSQIHAMQQKPSIGTRAALLKDFKEEGATLSGAANVLDKAYRNMADDLLDDATRSQEATRQISEVEQASTNLVQAAITFRVTLELAASRPDIYFSHDQQSRFQNIVARLLKCGNAGQGLVGTASIYLTSKSDENRRWFQNAKGNYVTEWVDVDAQVEEMPLELNAFLTSNGSPPSR